MPNMKKIIVIEISQKRSKFHYWVLKLPYLFATWLFWTFHAKSHNMKVLVIICHSWSQFLPLTCLYGKNELLWVSVQPSGGIFLRKKLSSDYPCKSHDHDHQSAVLVIIVNRRLIPVWLWIFQPVRVNEVISKLKWFGLL